jgi:hypothetical protein
MSMGFQLGDWLHRHIRGTLAVHRPTFWDYLIRRNVRRHILEADGTHSLSQTFLTLFLIPTSLSNLPSSFYLIDRRILQWRKMIPTWARMTPKSQRSPRVG